jgi:lipopolysaccharide export system protein LptA
MRRLLIALAVFLTVVPWAVVAQGRPGVIELKSAQELKGRTVGDAEVRELIGNVHFVQFLREGGMVKVWTDRALQYLATERVELYNRVRVLRDSVVIFADQGVYYGQERRVTMEGRVRLERSGSILTSQEGEYFPDERRAVFVGSVQVKDSGSVLTCDRLFYWEDDQRSVAVGSVRVVQLKDGSTVFGDSLVNFDREGRAIVPRSARMLQADSTGDGGIDTLLVSSREMESLAGPDRVLFARDSVRISRSDLSARCKSATFLTADDRIVLAGDPVVWHGRNQLTGDTIEVRLKGRRLHSVVVRGRAVAVSRADSLRPLRFDQLTGRVMTMTFGDGKVRQIDAEGTATSLYYLYDDAAPNGANRSSGDRILMDFTDGQIDRIKVVRGVQGEYLPEKMVNGREAENNLDGFRWFPTRPARSGLVMEERDVK